MRILVGIDQGAESTAALRWAAQLAHDIADGSPRDELRTVELLVAEAWQYPPFPSLAGGGGPADPASTDASVLSSLVRFSRAALGDELGPREHVRIEHVVTRGRAGAALCRTADERRVDLAVIGVRGGGTGGHPFGSVGAELLASGRTVVTVPAHAVSSTGPVVVPFADSAPARAAARVAGQLAHMVRRGEVVFIHDTTYGWGGLADVGMPPGVQECSPDAAARFTAELALDELTCGVPHRSFVAVGDPVEIIERVATSVGARLVVAGEGHVRRLWPHTSLASRLVAHTGFPLATVPDRPA